MLSLSGKVAVITGAGTQRGQGAATARLLAARGAQVVLGDLDFEASRECAADICESGGEAIARQLDVRVESEVAAFGAAALAEYGRLDIEHSQAADLGILSDPGDPDITRVTEELWRTEFETIVLGAMLACKHAIPAMVETGGGSIVCTSSQTSMVGELNLTVYGAAKAAVNQLVRSVSAQWGKEGIRCNAVVPGLVLSEPALNLPPEILDQWVRHCDTPYVAEPEDVAELVAFLASDASRCITGETIRIDGGFMSHSPMIDEQRSSGHHLPMTMA